MSLSPPRFTPIDLDRHFGLCVQFLCDALVSSYGTAAQFDVMGGEQGYLRGLRESLAECPDGFVHVWHDDRLVGQMEMRVPPESRIGVVNLFYLIPEERGGALGAQLQNYAVSFFRRHGAEKARLSVSPSNARALKYYTKHGWRDLGPRPDRNYVHAMELDIGSQIGME
jgi:ribosomal protein S18 acetylase RimI-like enzyme